MQYRTTDLLQIYLKRGKQDENIISKNSNIISFRLKEGVLTV